MEDQQSLTWLSQLQYQAGVVSRQQALDAGFTAKVIEWRLRSGAWRRLHRGVYATFTGALSRDARLWAAVLWVGEGAVLSHETAAEVQHLTDKPSSRIHLYERYGLCVELDGRSAHPAEGRWRDIRRDNANLVQGARTLRYGWPDVTEHRCRTAAEIAAVLRSQGWTGALRRCGPSCIATRTLIALQAQEPGKQEPGMQKQG